MKNIFGLLTILMLAAIFGFGCFGSYDHLRKVEQSGEMICLVNERYSAEIKVREPLSKAELFVFGKPFNNRQFPGLVVRDCSAINEKMMSLNADDGVYLWLDEKSEFNLKKLSTTAGNLSNDWQWFVTQEKRINLLTGEEIAFKTKLPSNFLGNSPDWKTIITEGENLVDQDLISLYVVDTETGASKQRFVRRANYLFMLNHAHQLAGIIADNLWISNQFRWVPDKSGKSQLVYPVLEDEEIKKAPALNRP